MHNQHSSGAQFRESCSSGAATCCNSPFLCILFECQNPSNPFAYRRIARGHTESVLTIDGVIDSVQASHKIHCHCHSTSIERLIPQKMIVLNVILRAAFIALTMVCLNKLISYLEIVRLALNLSQVR